MRRSASPSVVVTVKRTASSFRARNRVGPSHWRPDTACASKRRIPGTGASWKSTYDDPISWKSTKDLPGTLASIANTISPAAGGSCVAISRSTRAASPHAPVGDAASRAALRCPSVAAGVMTRSIASSAEVLPQVGPCGRLLTTRSRAAAATSSCTKARSARVRSRSQASTYCHLLSKSVVSQTHAPQRRQRAQLAAPPCFSAPEPPHPVSDAAEHRQEQQSRDEKWVPVHEPRHQARASLAEGYGTLDGEHAFVALVEPVDHLGHGLEALGGVFLEPLGHVPGE